LKSQDSSFIVCNSDTAIKSRDSSFVDCNVQEYGSPESNGESNAIGTDRSPDWLVNCQTATSTAQENLAREVSSNSVGSKVQYIFSYESRSYREPFRIKLMVLDWSWSHYMVMLMA
jgi:hypothetical protein